MDLLDAAVADNVEWCELVAGRGVAADGVWVAHGSPPPLFPDAVTLAPGVPAAALAARLADRPSCSVKDSFADLDLAAHGFGLLFEARWTALGPVSEPIDWPTVDDGAGLVAWCEAAGLPALPDTLPGDPCVRVLARRRHGAIVAGTILHRSETVVGLTNVFGPGVWDAVGALARTHFPDLPVVGYEHGTELDDALAAGFVDLGPLRVWLRG